MTPDQPGLTEDVCERSSLGNLPDDILRDIADLLETKLDEQLPELVLPTYETPRPFACADLKYWRPCPRPASLPGHMRIGADVRALRIVCGRTAQALSLAYFTDLALKIETMADIKTVLEAPYTVRMAASSVNFAIPWRVEGTDRLLPADSFEQFDRGHVGDGGTGCSELMNGIFDCLEALPQIKRLSITMFPFASKDHPVQCMRMQFAIRKTRPHRLPSLDRLTSIEIACTKYECCPFCTNSVIDIFQDYVAQCDTVKLGVTPNFYRRATFTAQISAQALYVRVDRPDHGATGLFHALKLSSISPNARKLVIHSTRQFINLKCLGDEITVEHVYGNLSFTRAEYEGLLDGTLTAMGRPAVEELDIRLKIRVSDDARFTSAYRDRAPDCAFWSLSIESEADEFVAWYALCLTEGIMSMNSAQIRRDQKQVLVRLADALPKLKRVWFWAKAPGLYDGDKSAVAEPSCWQWDALSNFRMAWTVDRSQDGENVYFREDGLEGPHPRSGQKRSIHPARLP